MGRASAVLANRAVFDLHPEVRRAAISGLRSRPRKEYQPILLKAFRYPWRPAAEHAAEAVADLNLKEMAPDLAALLDLPDPDLPFQAAGENGKPKYMVRELVRINHHSNCLLCGIQGSHCLCLAGLDGQRRAGVAEG